MLRRLTLGSAAVCAVALLGCNGDSPGSGSPLTPSSVQGLSVQDVATSASAGGGDGVLRAGAAPAPGGGPTIGATGNQTVINGGTQTVTVTGDAPFDRIYVFVGGKTLGIVGEGTGGIEGYYEIRLPSPQTTAVVLLTFPQEIPLTEFDLRFAVVSPSGAVGPSAGLATTVTSVGTGDLQVTLTWDVDSDVDLHVVSPGGEEVFYGQRQVASGGELDLDSNAGCRIDGVRNENITWPVGRAPRGVYTVRVDYWNSCGVSETNYTVRINNGGAVQIVRGSFTGPGDQGGLGSGRTVATFERQTGSAPQAPSLPLRVGEAPGWSKTGQTPGR